MSITDGFSEQTLEMVINDYIEYGIIFLFVAEVYLPRFRAYSLARQRFMSDFAERFPEFREWSKSTGRGEWPTSAGPPKDKSNSQEKQGVLFHGNFKKP